MRKNCSNVKNKLTLTGLIIAFFEDMLGVQPAAKRKRIFYMVLNLFATIYYRVTWDISYNYRWTRGVEIYSRTLHHHGYFYYKTTRSTAVNLTPSKFDHG